MASLTSVRYFAAVFFVLAQILATECTITKCDKINPCSCKSNEGVINLKPLDGTSTQASLQTADPLDPTGYQYFYNPCTDFSYAPATPQCQAVLGCQYSQTYGFGYDIADHSTAKFDVASGVVTLKMSSKAGDRYMEVKLICDKSMKNPQFTFLQENPQSTYKFSLTSEHACPGASGGGGGGLSFGSVLCIILLVVVIVYAIGGYAFNTYKRGAEGAERIPNVAFWKELPSLVKDGFQFATSCGKSKAAYDEI